ncbi:MAG: S41 family peptidase [Patescibacteria group bacterium]
MKFCDNPLMFVQYFKKFAIPVALSILIIAISFSAGVLVGERHYSEIEKAVALFNKESTVVAAPGTDFEPFWKTWNILNEKYVSFKSTTTDQQRVWGAISGLAESFGDPYTVFFPPQESKNFEASINGEFQGVGMEIGIRDRVITVISPLKGTPAFNAGIKAGDKILKIDGAPATEMTVEKAVSLIRGPKGTTVVISVFREGEKEPLEFKIVRDVINIPTIDTEKRPDGIFVIRLYSFSANSPQLFRNALEEFINSQGDKLILDLRNNPGGYLEAAVDMASWFLPGGKVVVKEESKDDGDKQIFRSKGYNIFSDKLKFVILVNAGSASASEILAGALSEHGIAKLVGEKTFGKGSVQELVKITPETSLKVTIARWLTPNGVSISEGGLKPDIEVVPTKDDITKGKDKQMEKAIEILNK